MRRFGLTIVGSIGDQWSDLIGARRSLALARMTHKFGSCCADGGLLGVLAHTLEYDWLRARRSMHALGRTLSHGLLGMCQALRTFVSGSWSLLSFHGIVLFPISSFFCRPLPALGCVEAPEPGVQHSVRARTFWVPPVALLACTCTMVERMHSPAQGCPICARRGLKM